MSLWQTGMALLLLCALLLLKVCHGPDDVEIINNIYNTFAALNIST
jgi:hypothetical protein